jgi:alpha-glucosidase
VALRRGGLRWLHVGADSLSFLREHPQQRLLVHVARAPQDPVQLPVAALGLAPGAVPEVLVGEPAHRPGRGPDAPVRLPDDGPSASVYLLPALG